MAEGLILKIGSDVSGAVRGIEEVSLTLKEQKNVLASLQKQYAALSTQQVKGTIGKELAADIKVASTEIKRLESVSTSSFGAIGSSATKGFSAVRQLAYVLPGIGIAGIFSAAFVGIGKLLDGLNSISNSTKILKDVTAEAKDEFVKAQTTVFKLTADIQLAKQGFLSKSAVLKEYNTTIGKTTGFVHSINEAERELIKNAPAFLEATLQKTVAQIAAGKAAEAIFQQEQNRLEDEQSGIRLGLGVLGNSNEDPFIKAERNRRFKRDKQLQESLSSYKTIYENAIKQVNEIAKQTGVNIIDEKDLKKAAESVERLKKLFLDLNTSVLKGIEDRSKFKLHSIFPEIDVDVSTLSRITERVSELKDQIELLKSVKVPGLTTDDQIEKLEKELSILQRINLAVKSPAGDIGKEIAQSKNRQGTITGEAKDDLKELTVIGKQLASTLDGAFNNLFDSIGKGTNAIQGFFSAIIQGIGQMIAKLLSAVAVAGILDLLGFGEFGALFKTFSGGLSLPHRAGGGSVIAGQPYMVGEVGRELFVPSTSGKIIPNHNLSSISGSANQMISVLVSGKLSGRDILLSGAREGRYQGRNV